MPKTLEQELITTPAPNTEDEPTVKMFVTNKGREVDLNNLPGARKMDLIESGEMDIDKVVTPPNMPGKKLKAMREAHRARVEPILERRRQARDGESSEENQFEETTEKTSEPYLSNTYKVGDYVEYEDGSHEVLKIDTERVQIKKTKNDGSSKKVWVHHTRVTPG